MSTVEDTVAEAHPPVEADVDGADDALTHSAERVIQDHVLLAVVSGFVPGPGLDMVAAFAVQMTMLKRLSKLYDIPFRQDLAKSTITSLFGTLGGAGAAAIAAASFVKFIPVLGTAVGIAGTSVAYGAFTYAIGKVYQRHFETGGTFIDLDPKAYRDYFREMNNRGRKVAEEKKVEAAATESRARPRRTTAAKAEA